MLFKVGWPHFCDMKRYSGLVLIRGRLPGAVRGLKLRMK
jgi:hypothetical protein